MNFGNTVFGLASLETCVLIPCLKYGGSEITRMILFFNWFSYLTRLNCWMSHTHLLFCPSHFGMKANKINEPWDLSKSWLPIDGFLTLWDQYFSAQPSPKMCFSAFSLTASIWIPIFNLPAFYNNLLRKTASFWSIQSPKILGVLKVVKKSVIESNSKVSFAEPTLFKKITCHTYTQEWFFIAKGMFFFVD